MHIHFEEERERMKIGPSDGMHQHSERIAVRFGNGKQNMFTAQVSSICVSATEASECVRAR